jgi:hypothetical protein
VSNGFHQPQHHAVEFGLTHNDNFPILLPTQSEFLAIALSNASGENTFYERDTSSSVIEIP